MHHYLKVVPTVQIEQLFPFFLSTVLLLFQKFKGI